MGLVYYAASFLLGILLLFLYYSRLDNIEKKFDIEFLRKENSPFPRFMDVWKTRKIAGHPGLKNSIILITLIRFAAMVAIWGPFLFFITKD